MIATAPMALPAQRWAPLRHWTDAELSGIAARFPDPLDEWARAWAMTADSLDLSRQVAASRVLSAPPAGSQVALPLNPVDDTHAGDVAQAWLCFVIPAQFVRFDPIVQFGMRLALGANCRAEQGSIAADLGAAALEALVSTACTVLGFDSFPVDEKRFLRQLPAGEFHALGGCVKVALPFADDVVLLLNGAAAQKLVGVSPMPASGTSGGLTAVKDAAAKALVELDVRMNPVELSFGDLKSLQIGDVVILPHALEAPLRIVTEFDTEIGGGFLGRLEDHRALQVVRRTTNT